ncbi:fibronectin type III domain containing protein [Elysia marginata]|uniref:Fibronectin type III domain containing protein n=1 Tax=Elysia marginata TaxID=1093978 RepID=A0AAV4F3D5_9GAST|nr:fibronectin type III domain containing protein [Elysia marginata]
MLSSNGPPMPMPMQVPPGHMVQQIVDEHGILTHVILSPQPPGPGGPLTPTNQSTLGLNPAPLDAKAKRVPLEHVAKKSGLRRPSSNAVSRLYVLPQTGLYTPSMQ